MVRLHRLFGKARSYITAEIKEVGRNILKLVTKRVMCGFTTSTPTRLFRTRNHRIACVLVQNRRTFERSVSIQHNFNLHLLLGVADGHEQLRTIWLIARITLVSLVQLLNPAHSKPSSSAYSATTDRWVSSIPKGFTVISRT